MKKYLALFLALTMIFALAACGQSSTPADTGSSTQSTDTAAPAVEAKHMKVSHGYAQTHPYHVSLLEFKETVERETNGAIIVDIYSDAAMGTSQDEIEGVISGTQDAAVVAALAMWQNWSDLAAVEEIPFLFPSYAEARAAFHGDFGDRVIEEVIEVNGVKAIGIWEFGYRHITNNTRPIVVPEDLAGLKFRVGPSDIRFAAFEAMGATPMTIAFNELFTALQQGTIDGQENPIMTIYSSSFYEPNPYLSLSGHVYNSGFFVVNQNFWDSLTSEQQEIIAAAGEAGGYRCEELIDQQESEAVAAMEEAGVHVNEVDKEAFVAAVQPVWEDFRANYGETANELLDLALTYCN